MTAYRTIKVKKYSDIIEEYVAAGTITPGMLVALGSGGTVAAHGTAGGNALPMFALEDELQGNGITDNYVATNPVQCWIAGRGDNVYALLATGNSVVIGDKLDSAGTGALRKHVAQTQPAEDGVYQHGNLAISATPEQFKTTQILYWRRNAIQFTKAATDTLAFSSAYTINTAAGAGIMYGAFLVQISDTGTISTKAVAADQAYASSALAIAALPAADTGNTAIGYIVVAAKTGADWVAITDDLTNGSDCETASFVDTTELTITPTSIVQNGVVAEALEALNNTTGADARLLVRVL